MVGHTCALTSAAGHALLCLLPGWKAEIIAGEEAARTQAISVSILVIVCVKLFVNLSVH